MVFQKPGVSQIAFIISEIPHCNQRSRPLFSKSLFSSKKRKEKKRKERNKEEEEEVEGEEKFTGNMEIYFNRHWPDIFVYTSLTIKSCEVRIEPLKANP